MPTPSRFLRLAALLLVSTTFRAHSAPPDQSQIPDPLKSWQSWATWSDKDRNCPTPYYAGDKRLCFWPSKLDLQTTRDGGRFTFGVTVYADGWVPLPGGKDAWPVEVKANGAVVPVVEHDGSPSLHLTAGAYKIEGAYHWTESPQNLPLPVQIGILTLTLDGKTVDNPTWDSEGLLWLKRGASSEEAAKDFLSVKVYASLDDGIPMWLHTQVELVVSGKSREEDLGSILPEGWKLSAVESPLPVAVDDAGRMRVQVRAGKWAINLTAFRLNSPAEVRYAEGAKPAVEEELIGFRAKPDFRVVDILGLTSIDVSQTTYPQEWRDLPLYRWDTATPFRIEERMRGMGSQKPQGLHISREFWLDEDGAAFTFRDHITGQMQQTWRLDAAAGQDLGSVRSGAEGQLITKNPKTGAPGVEIRQRNISFDATGRMKRSPELSATGWQADADALKVTLNLPPGWRLFAIFNVDWVVGDWLTAWTLLDIFLLLIFTLAVFRLWGLVPAIIALLAFGLSFHEPGAPRYLWLALLVPLALQRVVPPGWASRSVCALKWVIAAAFLLTLIPFLARQVQQTLYPQLEIVGTRSQQALIANEDRAFDGVQQGNAAVMNDVAEPQAPAQAPAQAQQEIIPASAPVAGELMNNSVSNSRAMFSRSYDQADYAKKKSNLGYDSKAKIQTGPGVPNWTWRTVAFGWNGPVRDTQHIHPILISLGMERFLSILRVVLMIALTAILLEARRFGRPLFSGKRPTTLAAAALLAFALLPAQAQMPSKEMLDTLRTRLLEGSDAYPNAADIPNISLTLKGRQISIDAEIHAATRTAVPIPGHLPGWSPISVLVDGKPDAALRRDDGFLWVVLSEGVHKVHVEGLLSDVTEWEWTFQLKPHHVTIQAPDWTFSGVRADGVPEQQVFFALKQKATAGQASYDRQDYQTVALVERNLELGLVWQVHTTVTRISSTDKAIALRIPLLPGENVVSSNTVVKDGMMEVRLGAHDDSYSWDSELSIAPDLKLATHAEDTWVEQWQLVASPIWNVTMSGLPPTFEPGDPQLTPVWRPWPGESVDLTLSRPEAISGATVTVNNGTYTVTLGDRQRVSKLNLSLRCSLGEDFLVDLPADAEITKLTQNNAELPVRKDGTKLIIPLRPGEQSIAIDWKTNTPLGFRAAAEEIHLPVESANITTVIKVPEKRWVLATEGPLRGPAVRFWSILICSLLAAFLLGRISSSPLHPVSWLLLAIGLTQIPLPAALLVIGWLFFLGWRGRPSYLGLPALPFNMLQVLLVLLTVMACGVFIGVVYEGLLGKPEMFIRGNGSTRTMLQWYQARCGTTLPQPACFSVSMLWYRLFMLLWALWLAASLLRWLRWGWDQFGKGGFFRKDAATPAKERPVWTPPAADNQPPTPPTPPPVPPQA